MELTDELRERMAVHLADFTPTALIDAGARHAAVAVTVTADPNGAACYLLTRRTPRLRAHSGQLALPGGRIDEAETPVQAALRELEEELGLRLAPEAVLGTLDDYVTRSGFRITPVVAWAGADAQLDPSPDEVAEVYHVPLAALESEEVPRLLEIPESDRPVLQIPLFGRYLHAPTAAVLYQFREVALHGRHTPVAHFEQPVWAWR